MLFEQCCGRLEEAKVEVERQEGAIIEQSTDRELKEEIAWLIQDAQMHDGWESIYDEGAPTAPGDVGQAAAVMRITAQHTWLARNGVMHESSYIGMMQDMHRRVEHQVSPLFE